MVVKNLWPTYRQKNRSSVQPFRSVQHHRQLSLLAICVILGLLSGHKIVAGQPLNPYSSQGHNETSRANTQESENPIRIGISHNVPLAFFDGDGNPQGIFVDILNAVATEEGWMVDYVFCEWSDCLSSLENGQIDLIAAIAYSEERDAQFDFTTETVFINWGQVYTRPDSGINSILDLEGKTVALNSDFVHARPFLDLIDQFNINIEVVEVEGFVRGLEMIHDGQVDVSISNRLQGIAFEYEFNIEAAPIIFNPVQLESAVAEGQNQTLIETIDRHLVTMRADPHSVYYQSLNRWITDFNAPTIQIPLWVKQLLLGGLGLLLLFIGFTFILRRQVRIRTFQLSQSESQLRAIFKSSINAIGVFKAGEHSIVNNACLKMFGYSTVQDFAGLSMLNLVAPDQRQHVADYMQQRIQGLDVPNLYETCGYRHDGTTFDMEMHVSTYELGGDVYTVVIIHDITKRKQTEHYLQGTLDSSLNGIMAFRSILDDNDNIIDFEWLLANKMSEKIIGRQEGDLIGKRLTVEMPGTLETGLFDFYVQVAETGAILEQEHHYAHESIESWFHTVAIKMDDGVAVTFADISEQRLIALAEREQRTLAHGLVKTAISLNKTLQFDTVLKVVLANINGFVPHDGAYIVLLDQEQLEIQVAEFCDCHQNSSLARPILNVPDKLVNYPPLMHMTTTNQALLIPDTSNHLLWFRSADPSIASFLGCPILIDQKPMGFLVLVSKTVDFFTPQHQVRLQAYVHQAAIAIHNAQLYVNLQTQLEQLQDAQARLVQREKLAAIGELSAGIAHELNNPLTSIILYSQLLEMQSVADAKVTRDINQIVTQAKRASSIVHGLLNFARQHPMERNPLQINEIVNKTIDLLAYEIRAHHVDLQVQLDEDLPLIIGDSHQLQQVLVNLINNALQAQQDNGEQGRIIIKSMTSGSQYNHSAIQEDIVQLTIQDNGPGIPPDIQKRIFDPFFTTKATGKGTGLGLSICHGIIKEHAGHISVESVVGQGTTFYIELPVTIPMVAIPISEPRPLSVTQNKSKQRILFIDDEEDILGIVERMLNGHYEVDVATNAQTALHKVAANSYDLLICDVHMPDVDGFAFYANWQQEQSVQAKSTPFLFVTGDVASRHAKEQLENLKVPFLVKPFGINTLLAHIQTLLPAV